MTERFNVSGALLVKLFGAPERESTDVRRRRPAASATSASRRRCTRGCSSASLLLTASLATALVYGWGGVLAVERHAQRSARWSR